MPFRFQQTNFLGGEWTPFFQGRVDHPQYASAMNLCHNGYPIEEGTWVRRQGTRLLAPTHLGKPALLYPLFFQENEPYIVEFTDDTVRFFNQAYPVITEEVHSVTNISTASPAVITLDEPTAWNSGDEILLYFNPAIVGPSYAHALRQRILLVTPVSMTTPSSWSDSTAYSLGALVSYDSVNYLCIQANTDETPASGSDYWQVVPSGDTNTYSLTDAITGDDIDGADMNLPSSFLGITALRSLRLTTPYSSGSWSSCRIIQSQELAVVVNGTNVPQALQISPNATSNQAASATIGDIIFQDGPYLNQVPNTVLTLGGLSGTVSCSIAFQAYDADVTYVAGDYVTDGGSSYVSLINGNEGNTPSSSPDYWSEVDNGLAVTGPGNTSPYIGFQDTDVGRLIRVFSQPETWDGGNYETGDIVYYNNLAYTAVANNSDAEPDISPTDWAVTPEGALWTWGQIVSVTNETSCEIVICGAPVLYDLTITQWQLGVYSDTTGYPTCGIFFQGRFWLGGSLPNRFDATALADENGNPGITPQGTLLFSPSYPDGTVTDNSAISYTLMSEEENPIYWMALDQGGIIFGTEGGEWLVNASSNSATGNVITPTSIQAALITRYRCANIEPRKTGISLVFVQAYQRRVMELLADVFTGRFVAPQLTEAAKHLTFNGVDMIWYQEELAPIIWGLTDGDLIGCTYRRTSMMIQEAPKFCGWHEHALGTDRTIYNIASGPNGNGTLDALSLVTYDSSLTTPTYWVEQLTTMFDEENTIYDAWFLDGAIIPDNIYASTSGSESGQTLTGLWYLAGLSVDVFIAGLDVGTFTVASDGSLFIPYGSGTAPTTPDYTAAGGGAWQFTEAWVNEVAGMNLTPLNGGIEIGGTTTVVATAVTSNPNGTSSILELADSSQGGDNGAYFNAVDWWNSYFIYSYSSGEDLYVNNISNGDQVIDGTTWESILGTDSAQAVQEPLAVDPSGNLYLPYGSASGSMCYAAQVTDSDGDLVATSSTYILPENPSGMVYAAANNGYVFFQGDTGGSWGVMEATGPNPLTYVGNVYGSSGSTINGDTGGGAMAAANATYNGNVASAFLSVQNASGNEATEITIYFAGVADGVPTAAENNPNDGSTGKKSKGKKGASPGGVTNVPSVDNPILYFAKVGSFTPANVDPAWASFNTNGLVVDFSDNGCILSVGMYATTTSSSWANTVVYNYESGIAYDQWVAGTYAADAVVAGNTLTNNTTGVWVNTSGASTTVDPETDGQTTWTLAGYQFFAWNAATTYASGAYVTSDTDVYVSIISDNTNNAVTDAGAWTQCTTKTASASAGTVVTEDTYYGTNSWALQPNSLYNVTVAPHTDALAVVTTFPLAGVNWRLVPFTYLLKFGVGEYSYTNGTPSGDTAGIVWTVPLAVGTNNNSYTPMVSPFSRVYGGLYCFMGGVTYSNSGADAQDYGGGYIPVWLIDTVAGTYWVGEIGGLDISLGSYAPTAYEIWDSDSQSLITYGSYTSSDTGAPTGVDDTATFDSAWFRLWVGNLNANPNFTSTASEQPQGYTFVDVNEPYGNFPCVVGKTYTSQGQILRQIMPQETGSRTGPAFGAVRRSGKYSALMHNTLGIQFGAGFNSQDLYTPTLTDAQTGDPLGPTDLYSGIWRDSLENRYSFDGMLAWQILRPYPASIVSIGAEIDVTDQ